MYFYKAYGLTLGSDIAFPELESRSLSLSKKPDVIVRWETSSEEIDFRPPSGMENGTDTEAVFLSPKAGLYRVREGREILVRSRMGADQALVRLFVLGSAMALIFHQRGLVALHASAVVFVDDAVAFAGDQGEGKSTLAAHCVAFAGAHMLCDDILVVTTNADARPLAYPGVPMLKLWRDALSAIDEETSDLRADWFRADKFHLPVATNFVAAPTALERLYVLASDDRIEAEEIERLTGAAALDALISNSYRLEFLEDKAQRPNHFHALARLAGSLEIYRLTRPRNLSQVKLTAARLRAIQERRGR